MILKKKSRQIATLKKTTFQFPEKMARFSRQIKTHKYEKNYLSTSRKKIVRFSRQIVTQKNFSISHNNGVISFRNNFFSYSPNGDGIESKG